MFNLNLHCNAITTKHQSQVYQTKEPSFANSNAYSFVSKTFWLIRRRRLPRLKHTLLRVVKSESMSFLSSLWFILSCLAAGHLMTRWFSNCPGAGACIQRKTRFCLDFCVGINIFVAIGEIRSCSRIIEFSKLELFWNRICVDVCLLEYYLHSNGLNYSEFSWSASPLAFQADHHFILLGNWVCFAKWWNANINL